MAKMGRPPILDEMKRREICALVSAGTGLDTAAYYVGCSTRTIRREAQRNDGFREALRRAEVALEIGSLRAIRDARDTHWRAAAWLLERTQPDRYAKKNPATIPPEVVKEMLERLVDAVVEEFEDDPNRCERAFKRLETIEQKAQQEFLAHANHRRDPRQELAEHTW